MEKQINNKTFVFSIIIFIIVFLIINFSYSVLAVSETNDISNLSNEEEMIYLSDIPYQSGKTSWGEIMMNKTASNTLISMYINGNLVDFKKGIWAHATSTLIYDLTEYDYDYFFTYYGVCTTSGNKGNGVKFYIYTSVDGNDWTLQTEEEPEALMSSNNAKSIKIDIRGIKYIKLYANDNGANGNDHAVYADTKLFKEGYSDNVTKTIEEYDELIKSEYNNSETIDDNLELLLLQREFVNNAGQYQLKMFFEESKENGKSEESKKAFDWLFNNVDILRLYIAGGAPSGTYVKSLEVLSDLYNKYSNDLILEDTTINGIKLSDIYTKMIISLSLTHSQTIDFWIYSTSKENEETLDNNFNISIATKRYAVFKDLFEKGKIETEIFESLEVEEMRYIMGSFINDDEIEWLCDYANTKQNKLSAYSYMQYKNVNTALYRSEKYYSEDIKEWEEKYNLTGYNVINKPYFPRLWMIMEVGGVCWQLSNVGQNVITSMGIPSTIVGQPGHVAYLCYGIDENGNGIWSLWNNVSGWTQTTTSGYTGTKGYYPIRLLNNWGGGAYASTNKGTYILLGQAALNDYDNYVKAKENIILANCYLRDSKKQEELYRKALSIQSFNLDAWLGLINLYVNDSSKTEEDLYNLATQLTESLKYYPLPMTDLLKLINSKITSPAYSVKFTLLQNKTLNEAKIATDNEVIQSDVVRTMANYLLGLLDTEIANFSFDGEKARIISLSSKFETSQTHWDYSLDGGKTWSEVDENFVELKDYEINSITAENDIKVHIVGVNYDESNIYTIDILKANKPVGLYNNDLENKVIGTDETMQWRMVDGEKWNSFKDTLPDLSGDKQVEVRVGATGIYLPSDGIVYSFTEDNQLDTRKYIPISHLFVHEVSSEESSKKDYAKNSIDGNINTIWHTAWNGSDSQRYITIKLDEDFFISAIEYVPRQDASNGRLKSGNVFVSMDGEEWKNVYTISNLENNKDIKIINLEEPVEAHYIKLVATENYGSGSFLSASMINLFEDSTKVTGPTATVSYSTTDITNQDVEATINFSEDVIINNNIELIKKEDGSYTYTFTNNSKVLLEFEDKDGNKGQIDLEVSWIDKKEPIATVSYNITKITNQDVIATINFNEAVTILNENLILQKQDDGSYTYTFMDNAEFRIEFEDMAGNKAQAEVLVNWIDKNIPIAIVSYDITETTSESVTATIKFSKEITILSEKIELTKQEDGSYNYTFDDNGEITLEFIDEAGNIGYTSLKVDWIKSEEEKYFISDKYNIQNGYITKIEENTSFNTFKENIQTNEYINLLDEEQNVLEEDTFLKTGMILKVGDELQYTIVINGDIDKDGKLTINDLAKLKLHLIEKEKIYETPLKAADIDGDGKVNINDLARMKLLLIGLE